MDFSEKKEIMIREHLIGRGISDNRVIDAMRKIRRENFILQEHYLNAYIDSALSSFFGQTISQPYIVALMTEQLEIFPDAKILEIGTGSGYQTAVLSKLSRRIFSIEKIKELSGKAEDLLSKEGCSDIHLKVGSGYDGWDEEAPFDRIIVTCAPDAIPGKLISQMKNEAIMIIPVGGSFFQTLFKITKKHGFIKNTKICNVKFIPMLR